MPLGFVKMQAFSRDNFPNMSRKLEVLIEFSTGRIADATEEIGCQWPDRVEIIIVTYC